MSLVAISFYALSLIFESCRLSEITLAGPHQYMRNNIFKIPVQKVLNLHTVLIENINTVFVFISNKQMPSIRHGTTNKPSIMVKKTPG